jgi:ABC-type phosphate/phosphonate transport system ATPase subunit
VERDGGTLQWIKTSGDISNITKFIDEKNTKRPREDSMIDISSSTRVSILVDVAGMGKSTLLNYLAQKIKKIQQFFWVTKVDLNDFTEELSEAVSEDLKTPQKAIEFLSAKIMKLKSQFERNLFSKSCESVGNVVLLFDGFDEVASYYKNQVIQLIKSLLKTKIGKFFIASRPEWSDYLERTFSQIKHALQPFGKEDQEHYMLKFLKERIEDADEVKLKRVIQTILKLMSTSISDNDYKFTGVPLITKLVGEFFESKISEYFRASAGDIEVFIGRLERETFDLIKLYDHFVEKKLQVYYEEKCKMVTSNPQASRTIHLLKQLILENYETLAVRQILKTDVEKYFQSIATKSFNEEELGDLVKVGLFYQVKNGFKFAHQTYAEFGFKKFLDKNFDDENCAKFIVEVVLVNQSYRVIRTFMNFWILEKVNDKTCAVYQKILLESSSEDKETPLHVAGREGNENIFRFLYSALATKTLFFKSMKKEIQNYLLKMPKEDSDSRIYPYTAFFYFFCNCEDHFNILSKIQSDFGVEFEKKIFTIQMNDNQNLLHAICRRDSENVFKVIIFLRDFFSNDLKFLRKVFLLRDKTGKSFLHHAFWFLKNEILTTLLKELNSLKSLLRQDFLNKLILMKSNYFGVFLSRYARSKHYSNDHFISFLNQIKFLCGQETLKKFFFVVDEKYSDTLLHGCCFSIKDFDLLQVLEWVARELGKEVLTELILLKDKSNYTFFFWFTSSGCQSNWGPKLLSILRFLKNDLKFENDFLIEKILFNDKYSDYHFSKIFEQNQEKEFYLDFLEFLANELNSTGESLKINLIRTKFLLSIAQNGDKQLLGEIFNAFVAKFGKTFFTDSNSIEIFHGICKRYSYDAEMILNYLNLVAEQIGIETFKTYISGKNSKKQTIFFHFHHYEERFTKMLEWFKTTFKNDESFFENFLLEADENSDSFFNFVLKDCEDNWRIHDCLNKTYDFLIRNFDKVFVKELLLLENKKGKNFLNIICENSKKRNSYDLTKILDILFKDFQNDQDFFGKLINEKSKKNREVKDFMKNKFKKDLPEDQTRRSKSCEIS